MAAAEDAYAAAVAEIERVRAAGETELDLSGEAFRALDRVPEEIAGLTLLQTLWLDNTQVADLAALSDLTALQTLGLNKTHVMDIVPLIGLTDLEALLLDTTQVGDLTPLCGLTALQRLWLNNTPVANLAPLSGLTALRTLGLNGTQVSDLTTLSRLTALETLGLHDTPVADVAPLSSLVALQRLRLKNTKVADLAPLSGLTALQTLDLDNTQVADLAPLSGLTALQRLDLDTTQVADLRPLRDLKELGKQDGTGLWFAGTPALRDPELVRLSAIKDAQTRTRETLAYLRTLPPYPEPLPWLSEQGEGRGPSLTAEILIEAQDLSGWRFSPTLGVMELFVRDTAPDDRQVTLAALADQRARLLLKKLAERSNSGGLRQEVFEEATRFTQILADDSRSLSTRSLELWASLIALGDHLDGNDKGVRDGRDPLDLLSVEARAALSTFLGVAASLVRSFPEARALDDDYGAFERRTATIEMVAEIIAAALRTNLVDAKSAALVQHVGEVAKHDGTQAHKASTVTRAGGMNLIKAAALVAAAPIVAVGQGALTDVGTDISNAFGGGEYAIDLIKHAIDFLADSGGDIQSFVDTLSPDERAVLKAAIADAQRNGQ